MKKLSIIAVLTACFILVALATGSAQVIPTNKIAFFRGQALFNGQPAPIGTVVDAFDPSGVHCGTFITDSLGFFGSMAVYGDDFTAPDTVDEGAQDGEAISFKINGRAAVVDSGNVEWHDLQSKAINISAGGVVGFELLPFDDVAVVIAPDDSVRFTVGVRNLGDGLDFYGVQSTSSRGWTTIDMATPAYALPNDTAMVYFDVIVDIWDILDVDTVNFSVYSLLDSSVKVDAAYVIKGFDPALVQFTVLTPAADTTASVSETVGFTVEIQNDFADTSLADYYSVTATSAAGWATNGDNLVMLKGQEIGFVNFQVDVPGTINTLSDVVTYTISSLLDTTVTYTNTVNITIPLDPNTVMTVVTPAGDMNSLVGLTVRVNVEVRNDGTGVDIYGSSASTGSGWTVSTQDSMFNSPGNSIMAYFDVDIPVDAWDAVETVDYSIFSLVDGSQIYNGSMTITVNSANIAFTIVESPQSQSGIAGDTIMFSLAVRNDGEISDIYGVSPISVLGWTIIISDSIPNLVGDTAFIDFSVVIPSTIDTSDVINYKIFSYLDTTVNFSGSVNLFNIITGVDDDPSLPSSFAVNQNYPNPFNPTTTIAYSLPGHSQVRLDIINILGQIVETKEYGDKASGQHSIEYDASHLSSGVYFYRISSDYGADTRKMVLLK